MPLFKVKTRHLKNYSIGTEKLSNTAVIAFAQTLTPKVRLANTANSSYSILDDAAVNISGGYIVLTGSDFQSGAQVLVGNTPATSTSFVNSSILQVQVPSKSAGTYNIFVVNPDGGTAIRVNGITYGTGPAFSTDATLSDQYGDYPIGFNIVATSDTSITYANTTTLPVGTTLMANGWFYGSNTVSTDTNYTFTVKATDAELQDVSQTFTMSVKSSYKIWSWGDANRGQLGNNTAVGNISSPTQIGGIPNWTKISASKTSSYPGILARKSDGTLWSWGVNYNGQLGVGPTATITGVSSPTQINASTDWSNNFAILNTQSVAIKTDNKLWLWGNAADGGQGNNSRTADRTAPATLDGGAFNWVNASIGDNAGFAIKSDGTLWGWGRGSNGQQGSNTIIARSSPVQIGTLTNWSDVRSSNFACIALKTDGTLWSWGYGNFGFTGQGDQVDRSSPVQIGTDTNWSKIYTSSGTPMVAAIKTDGTLWAWGRNNYGMLGQNSIIDKYVPTQVGTLTDWTDVGLGEGYMAAIRSNGTLWTCGRNTSGQLGLNRTGDVSSPTQVGTRTNWYQVAGGIDSCFALTKN